MRDALRVLALTLLALALRLGWLLKTPHPTGTDGYYYVVQVENWARTGALHVPDGSWSLRALGLAAWATGEPILGVKLGAAALAALCVPAAWLAGRRLAGAGGAWALAAWALASPTLTHLAGDFPKNLGAVAPLLLVLGLWPERGRSTRWGLLAGAALAAATAHRLGAGLLLLGLLGAALGEGARRLAGPGVSWGSRPRWLGALLLTGGAFLALSLTRSGLLHPADLERLTGQLDLSLGAPPPWPWFSLRNTRLAQQAELALVWPAAALALVQALRRPALRPLALAGLLALGPTLLPWRRDTLDLGYRLSLMGPILAVPLLIGLTENRWRELGPRLGRWSLALALLAPLSLLGFAPQETPPYARFERLIERLPRPLPTLLIAHQGINFLYDHRTGEEAMAWAPEPELDRAGVGRVAWGIRDSEWRAYARGAAVSRLDAEYDYVEEADWEAFLSRAEVEGDEDLRARLQDWRNPRRVRPASLTRGR
ncbi:MAG: hypothetical protein H6741_07915 [Alphaproteobacteria bacterium]|nr:hypothetical protein [Alphaproteobacteria bacterium]